MTEKVLKSLKMSHRLARIKNREIKSKTTMQTRIGHSSNSKTMKPKSEMALYLRRGGKDLNLVANNTCRVMKTCNSMITEM